MVNFDLGSSSLFNRLVALALSYVLLTLLQEQPRLSYAAMLSRKAAAPKPNPQPEPATSQSSKTQSSSAQPTQATSTTTTSAKPQRQSARFSHRGDRDRDSYGETNTRYPLRREHYGGRRSPPHQKPSSKWTEHSVCLELQFQCSPQGTPQSVL